MKNKIISLFLVVVMVLSSIPMTVFAQSSIGSNADNTSLGEDYTFGTKTEYAEVGVSNTQTQVYLTVEDSNLIASLPTTIILSGTPNSSGEYIGEYFIGVSGDMAGDKIVTIEPESNTIALKQSGKNDKTAEITQEQTEFDTDDFKNNTKTTGKVTAKQLTAGSWNGIANFELSVTTYAPTRSVSEIAKTVMGYNARNTGKETAILGGDNISSDSNSAYSYDAYVLPLSELGVNVGDTMIFTNSNKSTGFIYAVWFLDGSWNNVKSSNYAWANINREVVIEDNYKYISFYVINELNVKNPFNKADIPFNDFKFYKNAISNENEIDYISVWNKMIDYDNNIDFGCELWGHNIDWDYQDQQSQFNNQSLEKNLKYFDGYDLDLRTTSDGVTVCWYNATGYDKAEQHTFAELKEKYPHLMTFEEMAEYIRDNNKKCFVMPFTTDAYEIAERVGILDKVYSGSNDATSISRNGNKYIFTQSSQNYNLDTYLASKNAHTNFYINTDDYLSGGAYFTDTQINELLENDINVGISFCGEHKVTAFVAFCKDHEYETLFKVNHFACDDENALKCLKAAMRYVYGM